MADKASKVVVSAKAKASADELKAVRETAFALGMGARDMKKLASACVTALELCARGKAKKIADPRVRAEFVPAFIAGYMLRNKPTDKVLADINALAEQKSDDELFKAGDLNARVWYSRLLSKNGFTTTETRGGYRGNKPADDKPADDKPANKPADNKPATVPTAVTPVDAAKWLREQAAILDAFVATNATVLPATALELVVYFRSKLAAILK